MADWSAFQSTNTTKTSTEEKSVWATQSSTPHTRPVDTQQGASQPSKIEINLVQKSLPIFTMMVPDYVNFNKYMKKVILDHREKNPETTKSNVKAWHSSWQTHLENPNFQPLTDIVLNACSFVSQGYFQTQELEFSIFNCWASMYEKGEYTVRHAHFPSDFAATYYVDVEEGSSPIIFENLQDTDPSHNSKPLSIQPKNGMLAIWPGILHHEVPPTPTKRMVVAMNCDSKR